MDLIQRLQEMGRQIATNAPSRDPQKTNDCPTYSTLAALAEERGAQNEHVAACSYCQSVIAAVQRQQAQVALIVPDNTAPVTNITHELRAYAARWFQMNQPSENVDIAGAFDSNGTLHLSLHDLTVSGRVRVRLVADEMPLPLIETQINSTHWESEIAMPDWNLRNVRIARECVELVAL